MADDTNGTTNGDAGDDNGKGGKFKWLVALVAAISAGFVFMKKKREQELDEALWEEPRAL